MVRILKVLLFCNEPDSAELETLKQLVLRSGCAVHTSHSLQELADILIDPRSDYGLCVILNKTERKISPNVPETKYKILEFLSGRCSVTKIMEMIQTEAKRLGRYLNTTV